MSRFFVSIMAILLIALPLSACGGPGKVKLTEEDAGSTVEVSVGATLEVVLEGNPTTGYNWEMAPGAQTVLQQVGEAEFKPDSAATGSGGQVTLRFEAVTAGQTRLELIYHRPWEENVDPLETWQVTVVVK